ncbi:tetratricopeptide repeat protein [Sneathiella aquimaris]|uniref:tetratricopeptide repeat protein n=1 Tax=Sneathiella aquimaris TaxID=2599305 RepID=UPI00146B2306|nr:tetratricopeptide repeat protein [Sneathiella aquimaris]
MSDIFSEVDEEVRKDKSMELWNRYGKFVIAGSILVVAATAATVGWKNYQQSESRAQGKQFEDALALIGEKKFDEASSAFAALAETGSEGYQALALLRQADALLKAGKGDEAVAVFDAIAANDALAEEFRGLASIKAGFYLLDNGTADDVRQRVTDASAPGGIWSALAKEILALNDLKAGKIDEARQQFSALKEDASAPSGVKQRAAELLLAIENK